MPFSRTRHDVALYGVVIVVLLSLLWVPKAGAAGQPSGEPKVFVVGVQNFADYLPYSEFQDGHYRGFNRDLLDLFVAQHNYIFEYQARPLKRLYREFLQGEYDFKYPDNSYWSAEQKSGYAIRYSDTVVQYTDGVMVRPDGLDKQLTGLRRLGVVLGFTPFPYLDVIKQGEVVQQSSFSIRRLLKRTMLGQLDGVYTNIAVGRHYLANVMAEPNALTFDDSLPHVHSSRHLSTLRHHDVIDEFNLFLREQAHEIIKLKGKYRIDESDPKQ